MCICFSQKAIRFLHYCSANSLLDGTHANSQRLSIRITHRRRYIWTTNTDFHAHLILTKKATRSSENYRITLRNVVTFPPEQNGIVSTANTRAAFGSVTSPPVEVKMVAFCLEYERNAVMSNEIIVVIMMQWDMFDNFGILCYLNKLPWHQSVIISAIALMFDVCIWCWSSHSRKIVTTTIKSRPMFVMNF